MNSVTLFAATHSKLRKALDETGTQIATCMINKWTAKISGRRMYNNRDLTNKRGTEKNRERKRKEDGCSS